MNNWKFMPLKKHRKWTRNMIYIYVYDNKHGLAKNPLHIQIQPYNREAIQS